MEGIMELSSVYTAPSSTNIVSMITLTRTTVLQHNIVNIVGSIIFHLPGILVLNGVCTTLPMCWSIDAHVVRYYWSLSSKSSVSISS
mmetsp:Transcript_33547/g.66304  ORF Transcript_33547/g.66304 Transcript_33547/m.66304 type:complete len:87 (+) Transcript_33547:66-326(+)